MSGEKFVRITLARWYRSLVAQPMVRMLGQAALNGIASEVTEMWSSDRQAVRDQQAVLEQTTRELSERNQAFQVATSRRLDEHMADMARRIESSSTDLRTELLESLADTDRSIRAELDEQRRTHHADIQRIE